MGLVPTEVVYSDIHLQNFEQSLISALIITHIVKKLDTSIKAKSSINFLGIDIGDSLTT